MTATAAQDEFQRSMRPDLSGFAQFAKLGIAEPHHLYTLIAAVFGVIFLFVTPPAAGPDEPVRFEMIYDAATGAWGGAEEWPAGLAEFDREMMAVSSRLEPYTQADRDRLNAIALDKDALAPRDNGARRALRIHNPVASLPYAPAMWMGLALDWSPATIFLLCKFVTLFLGIALMREAIRIMPARRMAFLFVALLPTSVFMLGTVNFDALLIGASFLFFAIIAKACSAPDEKATRAEFAALLALGLYIACAKTPNAFFPLIAVLLPISKFASRLDKYRFVAGVFVPGLIIAVAWAWYAKSHIVGDMAYSGPGGDFISPSRQLAGILADPLGFLELLFRTMARPERLGKHMIEAIGLLGWNQVFLPDLIYGLVMIGGTLLIFNSDPGAPALSGRWPMAFQVALFLGIVVLSQFFLYLQWSGVGRYYISGFQGRYLLPLMPLFLCWFPGRMTFLRGAGRQTALAVSISLIALTAGVLSVLERYTA